MKPGQIFKIFGALAAMGLGLAASGLAQNQNAPTAAQAAQAADANDGGNNAGGGFSVDFMPNADLAIILGEYELRSGKRVIRDAALQGATLTMKSNGRFATKEESIAFIEKSLLLNGFAIIPTEDPDTMKAISVAGGKQPRTEGVPIFTKADDLPEGDDVVTYIMPLSYLPASEAAEVFTTVMPVHPHGMITPLNNAEAVVITENASLIRKMIQLREEIDLPPTETEQRSFQLERADAEDVAEGLADILGLDSEDSPVSPGASRSPVAPNAPQIGNNNAPGGANLPGANNAAAARNTTYGGGASAKAAQPIIRPIARTNRIFVEARPADMARIEQLIEHLDAPAELSQKMERKLNHLSVLSFMQIAGDALVRGMGEVEVSSSGSGVGGAGQGAQGNASTLSNSNGFGNNRFGSNSFGNSGFGSSGFGSSGFGSSGFGGGFGGGGGAQSSFQTQNPEPVSMVIGKTLLIGDSLNETLLVFGPQEHLDLINDLIDSLDIKPRQIKISAIIAQLSLGDDFDFGFDLLRTLETAGPDGRIYNGAGIFKSRIGSSQALLDINDLDQVANFLPAAQGLSLYGQINPYLDGFLSTLEATDRFKVLSQPSIYTVNNKPATILTGQRVAVPRSTQSVLDSNQTTVNPVVTASIDFVNVVLQIDVLPHINDQDEITLQINQVNDDIVGSQTIGADQIPTIGTQSLSTTIIVQNGGTVLLGGLISEDDRKNESGLPLFTNVPFVGKVFGSQSTEQNRQELLIFIQPQIIDDAIDQESADQEIITRTGLGPSMEEFTGSRPTATAKPAKKQGWFRSLFSGKKGS
ncbi:MAG: hypothetical protein H7A53_12565 [Akkermansiaceae bacterium]|nr:hypothetical protein [Akkermansiaceae bacterium]MCP5551714.1 hypothetical protein [Akkermansiaceae bacterium]